jgi:hypothetical protein
MLIFNHNISVNKNLQTFVEKISSVFDSKGTTTTVKPKRSVSLTKQNKEFLKSLGLTLRND